MFGTDTRNSVKGRKQHNHFDVYDFDNEWSSKRGHCCARSNNARDGRRHWWRNTPPRYETSK